MAETIRKSLLDELEIIPTQSATQIIESKAAHVISAVKYIREMIEQTFPAELAEELDRRLILALQNDNPKKFLGRIREVRMQNVKTKTSF